MTISMPSRPPATSRSARTVAVPGNVSPFAKTVTAASPFGAPLLAPPSPGSARAPAAPAPPTPAAHPERPRATALSRPGSASEAGAWHRPGPSPLHVAVLGAIAALAVALGSGCTDEDGRPAGPGSFDTPRSPVPAPLAGEWFTGSLSTLEYYDSTTGELADPGGEGFYVVLSPDGVYQTGAVITTVVGGCTSRLLGDEQGTLTVEGAQLTIYRDHVTVEVASECGDSGTRTQGPEVRELTWNIRRDSSDLEWLDLVHTDGSIESYRRWTN